MFVAVVLVLLAATACSSASAPTAHRPTAHQAVAKASSSPAAPTTVTSTFAPYAADGTLTATVSEHLAGNCWTSSIALPSAHTYRCLADNQILDPCFAPPTAIAPSVIACFTDPWTPGIDLRLTQPLPAADPGSRSTPWAIQLSDGVRCVVLTGTVDQVGALDLEYRCGTTGEAGLVSSTASAASTAALRVEYRASTAQPLQELTVTTEWRG